jgi:hypothetical protein
MCVCVCLTFIFDFIQCGCVSCVCVCRVCVVCVSCVCRVCVCVSFACHLRVICVLQIYRQIWGARLGVPLVFRCIKDAVTGLMGGSRWAILKKKLDWYPHHLALHKYKNRNSVRVFCARCCCLVVRLFCCCLTVFFSSFPHRSKRFVNNEQKRNCEEWKNDEHFVNHASTKKLVPLEECW